MNGKCTLCRQPVGGSYDLCRDCFEKLEPVRVASSCGPCLTYYRQVRENRSTVTVAFQNGSGYTTDRVSKGLLHREPCRGCADAANTMYPDGYMD